MANNRRLTVLTIALAVVVVVLGVVMVLGANHKAAPEPEPVAVQTEEPAVEEVPSQLESTLFFASDYQESDQGVPKDNLTGILEAVKTDHSNLDGALFCGDYSNVAGMSSYQITPENGISEIKSVMTEIYPDLAEDKMIFSQGNHDAMTISILSPGLHEFDDYLVYVNNTEIDFPWQQGATSKSLY